MSSPVKLQVAIDFGSLEAGIDLVRRLGHFVDLIEVGTHLIILESIRAVAAFREAFPEKIIVADLKIVDAGGKMAALAFEHGANITTVLGCSADNTVKSAVETARQYQGRIMLDLLGVADKLRRTKEAKALGVDLVCLHTAWDDHPSTTPNTDLIADIANTTGLPFVIAGGVKSDNIPQLASYHPYAVIVGREITLSPDPTESARKIWVQLQAVPSNDPLTPIVE